ncbi:MAG TPA: cytochrome c peroxidase [Gemmatimonadales bacterium]
MRARSSLPLLVLVAALGGCSDQTMLDPAGPESGTPQHALADGDLDARLAEALERAGFTGRIAATLETRLGRPLDHRLALAGRLVFFDPVTGLNGDNSCAGCHAVNASFNDSKSIAIGIENNGVVGPGRVGPRNQRRSPTIVNAAFFPTLMWNSRFRALSGDPFDNSAGFDFPLPEGRSLSHMAHLLGAQAHIPFTERVEMTGFDFAGDNDAIRGEVLRRLNAIPRYRTLFGQVFPDVRAGGPITFEHVGAAIAEFTFTLTFADAPIDRYARGELRALSADQKQGALLFLGRAGCVQCHAVAGRSNEMFSDFEQHVIGVPQIASSFGNVPFDGPGGDEDFGLEQVTGDPADRYMFRTSPIRNVALQPTFMHNGAFVRLEDAIRHHLNVRASVAAYTGDGLDADLRIRLGPMEPVLERLDPLLRTPIALSAEEFDQLVAFVRDGLTDPAARPERLRHLLPGALPSGEPLHRFEFRFGSAH